MTLTPGVYRFGSSAQLTDSLTLDALGDANARFVFQIGTTLTAASTSAVNLISVSSLNGGPDSGPDSGLFWQVGSSATIGTNSDFAGNILALASVTLNTGASLAFGRALAITGAVTLDGNSIDASNAGGGFGPMGGPVGPGDPGNPGPTPVPEGASTFGLAASGLLLLVAWRRRRARGVARRLVATE